MDIGEDEWRKQTYFCNDEFLGDGRGVNDIVIPCRCQSRGVVAVSVSQEIVGHGR